MQKILRFTFADESVYWCDVCRNAATCVKEKHRNLRKYVLWCIFAKNMNDGKMRFGVCSLCAEESKEEFCVSEKRAIVYAKTSYGLLLRKRTLECVKA